MTRDAFDCFASRAYTYFSNWLETQESVDQARNGDALTRPRASNGGERPGLGRSIQSFGCSPVPPRQRVTLTYETVTVAVALDAPFASAASTVNEYTPFGSVPVMVRLTLAA